MKILLLGDYSNCHRTLATGLRRLGHDVTVASDGTGWMRTARDIDITRRPGKTGGLRLWLDMKWGRLHNALRGYDIVAVNDINFVLLRPSRLRPLFDRLKRENGAVFLTAMSTDIAYLDMVQPPRSPLRYSEWFTGDEPSRMHRSNPAEWDAWHDAALVDYQRHAFRELDGAVSVLYEYHLGIERAMGHSKVAYGGIPIDTSLFEPVNLSDAASGKVRLFLGRDRTRKLMKGTDLLEEAAREVVRRHPDRAELDIVENVPYDEFRQRLRSAHVVLDQIYSYTPATTALMAMAYGLNVVSGGEPEYYDFIGETDNRPVINAPIELDALTDCLEQTVLRSGLIAERGRRSREFVLKHNDCTVVARRFLDFWTQKPEEKRC